MPSQKRGHFLNLDYLSDHLGIGCTNLAEAHFVGATTLFSHLLPSALHITWNNTIGLSTFWPPGAN